MALDPAELPDDVTALKAMLVVASIKVDDLDAEIENLKLTIAKLQHDAHGKSSERTSVLMDQLELQLGELIERRAQDKAADEIAAQQTPSASGASKPSRRRTDASRRAVRSIRSCRASVASSPRRRPARAAAANSGSSARTSPRCWSACRRAGR